MFENFRPKPKQETVPIVSENTTENKESLENQIEQETIKLDANLEVLKAEIDSVGGIEGLSAKINKYATEPGLISSVLEGAWNGGTMAPNAIMENPLQTLGNTALAGGITITAFYIMESVINLATGSSPLNVPATEMLLKASPALAAIGTGVAVGGGVVLGSVVNFSQKVSSWFENRKLKSLKNKAEVAGIA